MELLFGWGNRLPWPVGLMGKPYDFMKGKGDSKIFWVQKGSATDTIQCPSSGRWEGKLKHTGTESVSQKQEENRSERSRWPQSSVL